MTAVLLAAAEDDLAVLKEHLAACAEAYDALMAQRESWHAYYTAEELGCGDKQQTAIELMAAEAAWARSEIQFQGGLR